MRVRVKICGISRPEWGEAAAKAGADAIGLVFADSPRRVTPSAAADIIKALPPWVAPVGVFVDEAVEVIRSIAEQVGLATVQLHGGEPAVVLGELGRLKVIKAVSLGTEADLESARRWRGEARRLGRLPDAWLVDAAANGGRRGGTGRLANWTLAAKMRDEGFWPLILAGGLTPENAAEAIRAVRPWGVDASGGVESAVGVKSPERIEAFVRAAAAAAV